MDITDSAAASAQTNLSNAYYAAIALPGAAVLPADISGLALTPGLYSISSAAQFETPITLDAQGDTNAVFIFQIGSTLTTSGSAQVVLVNGAQAKNIFWAVGTSATLGTSSTFAGTIMALTSITLDTSATLQGRALAHDGAVTLDTNTVTDPKKEIMDNVDASLAASCFAAGSIMLAAWILPELRDFEVSKDRDLHAIQNQSKDDGRYKFSGYNRYGQWRHQNPPHGQC
jgi:hypothetical protein